MPKPDAAHRATDDEIAKLERRIARLYREAADDLQETIEDYFEKFKKRDEEMKALIGTVQNGKEWTEQDYKLWRLNQIGRGRRYEALRDKIAQRMTNAHETAISYVNDATPGIYSLNRNYAAYTIERVAGNVDFTLWDEQTVRRLIVEQPDLMPYYPKAAAVKRGIDLEYGKKQITKCVTSSVLQGKSIKGISDDLQRYIPTMSRDSAIRTARTAVTGAQNAGRMDSYVAAEKIGIKVRKEWLATLDGRTRHSHAMLDGQTADIDKPFKVDGEEIMFPGDTSAPGYLVYNCRCTLIAAVDGVDTSNAQRRVRNTETGKNELVSDMTYSEWAGWKEKAQVQKAMEQPKVFREEDYRAFETGEQTNDFFYYDDEKRGLMARKKSAHGQWTSGLSQEEARAIGQYCADGYYDINNYWRRYGDWKDINAERVKHQTEMLDGVIARYDLKQPIKVYRAIQPEAFESYWDDIQKIVGTEYTDAGFMSTSPIKTSTAVNKDCIMELFIPSGKGRGAYVNNVSGFQDEEYEFLLARDSKFRVIGAEETEDKLILKMEWIGNGQ